MTRTLKKCLKDIIMIYVSKKKVTCGAVSEYLILKGYPPEVIKKAFNILILKMKRKHVRKVKTRVFTLKESFYYPDFLIKSVSKLFYKGLISLKQVEKILNSCEMKNIDCETDVFTEIKNKSYSYYEDIEEIRYC